MALNFGIPQPQQTNPAIRPPISRGAVSGMWSPGGPPPPPEPTPQARLYNSAVAQDASDRSGIMDAYSRMAGNAPAQMQMPSPTAYSPTDQAYHTGSLSGAMNNLEQNSRTGGYSDQNIQDMRARSISPIRAIYANAQREIARNRRIAGGFSPNYNATRARMARDMSTQIGDRAQQVEGELAAGQAQGRLTAGGQFANAAASDTAGMNAVGAANTAARNQAGQFNLQFPLQVGNYNNEAFRSSMAPIQGMQSLYGTTPANSSLFGSQALATTGLQNQMDQQNQNNQLQFFNTAMGRG